MSSDEIRRMPPHWTAEKTMAATRSPMPRVKRWRGRTRAIIDLGRALGHFGVPWVAVGLCAAYLTLGEADGETVQTINLICHGSFTLYEPKTVTRTLDPGVGATFIDLEGKKISTPVGEFSVNKITDAEILFDDPKGRLTVSGHLDRLTGAMTIFWRHPTEDEKMRAGLPSKTAMYAELNCVDAKPL
jgi:hypothetical protein